MVNDAAAEYQKKLRDPRWQKRRLEIFERDDWTCQGCGAGLEDGKELHVHHRKYVADDPWDEDGDLLVTACWECHANEHEALAVPVEQFEARITRLRMWFGQAYRLVAKVIGEAEALDVIKKTRFLDGLRDPSPGEKLASLPLPTEREIRRMSRQSQEQGGDC